MNAVLSNHFAFCCCCCCLSCFTLLISGACFGLVGNFSGIPVAATLTQWRRSRRRTVGQNSTYNFRYNKWIWLKLRLKCPITYVFSSDQATISLMVYLYNSNVKFDVLYKFYNS